MLQVDTSSLTKEQLALSRTQACIAKANAFFNSQDFYDDYCEPLAFHEAGHAVYAARIGAKNLKFNPPAVRWDEKRNAPSVMWAYVSFTLPKSLDLMSYLKIGAAGRVVQQKLAPSATFEAFKTPVLVDTALAKSGHLTRGGKEEEFEQDWARAENEILQDLDNLAFRRTIQVFADAFMQRIFPMSELRTIAEVSRLTELLRETKDARFLLASHNT